MTLDEQFLKYKLEKIKNEDIFKDQDSGIKKRIRKANSKKAKKEANAIHSYLTGIDTIQPWNKNRSFISDESIPGSLTISGNGKLDIVQVKGRGRGPLSILKSRQLKIFKKLFDSLNIIFKRDSLSIGGNLLVEKDVEIGGNLVVFSGRRGAKKGTTTFQGNYIFDGTLEVKKNTRIRNHLFVSKNIGSENLTVSENVVSENLTVNSDFSAGQGVFNKELTVYGKTTIEQDVNVSKDLGVGGELNVEGEFNIEGAPVPFTIYCRSQSKTAVNIKNGSWTSPTVNFPRDGLYRLGCMIRWGATDDNGNRNFQIKGYYGTNDNFQALWAGVKYGGHGAFNRTDWQLTWHEGVREISAGDRVIRIVQTGGEATQRLLLYSVICQWVAPIGDEFVLQT